MVRKKRNKKLIWGILAGVIVLVGILLILNYPSSKPCGKDFMDLNDYGVMTQFSYVVDGSSVCIKIVEDLSGQRIGTNFLDSELEDSEKGDTNQDGMTIYILSKSKPLNERNILLLDKECIFDDNESCEREFWGVII